MNELIEQVRGVAADPKVSALVESRMTEFAAVRDDRDERLYLELCFCLLTANFQSAKSITIHDEIGDGFLDLDAEALAKRLRELGYRFPNVRARFIVEAREHIPHLRDVVYGHRYDDQERRAWLEKHVKGLGFKEASHYLRNVGVPAFPIVDRHIVALLDEHGLVQDAKKPITKSRYLAIEETMNALASSLELDHGRLDYYLWYLKTGTVLK